MFEKSRRAAIAGGSLVFVLAAGAGVVRAVDSRVTPNQSMRPDDPHLQQCLKQGQHICNPSAWQYLVSHSPVAGPPSANPHYISRDTAIVTALRFAATPQTPVAPASSPVQARMMSRTAYERLDPNGGENYVPDPRRLIWVVTVHASIATSGGPARPPEIKDVYTVAIDAETGWITDACIGCATLTTSS